MEASSPTEPETVDAQALRRLLDGQHRMVREHTRAILLRPEFARASEQQSTDSYRAQISDWTERLASTGGPALLFPEEFGGLGRVGEAIASFETLALSRPIAARQVRRSVRPLRRRGPPPRHAQAPRALPGADRLVRAARRLRDERVRSRLQRPAGADDRDLRRRRRRARDRHARTSDRKDYIGNAARDGRLAAVFAQLVVGGERRGVHACSCRSATTTARSSHGVRIEDCGHKLGLNGVDNGRIWFDGVRVPREACSTATARSPTTASTSARSRTRTVASSRCSAR